MVNKKEKKCRVVIQTQKPHAGRKKSEPKWLRALRDPKSNPPSGVPDENATPSLKYRSVKVGSFTTFDSYSTGSVGSHGIQISFAPWPVVVGASSGTEGVIARRDWNSGSETFSGVVKVFGGDELVPNTASMFPDYLAQFERITYRCTAMSVNIRYEGTELERAGSIIAGTQTIAHRGDASNSMNPINAVFSQTATTLSAASVSEIRNSMIRNGTLRNPDGSVSVRWFPKGIPMYGPLPVAGKPSEQSPNCGSTPIITFVITGDTTSALSNTGNTWSYEAIYHWEVIPWSPLMTVVAATPSPYNVRELQICLNAIQRLSAIGEDDPSGHHMISDGVGSSRSEPLTYGGQGLSETVYNYIVRDGGASNLLQGLRIGHSAYKAYNRGNPQHFARQHLRLND